LRHLLAVFVSQVSVSFHGESAAIASAGSTTSLNELKAATLFLPFPCLAQLGRKEKADRNQQFVRFIGRALLP
jgi:hypothetical protein